MTKKYSVPKNRNLTVLLLNTPYPPEPRQEAPSDLVWMDEIAEIPQDRYTMVEPKTIGLPFELGPDPTPCEPSLPYRDKKVMHPWSRRKKR